MVEVVAGRQVDAVNQQGNEAEEVVLFPELAPFAAKEKIEFEPTAEALRTWLAVQLSQLEGQLRNHRQPPKPTISQEVAAYFEACAAKDRLKASKDAYLKALNKLEHYARQQG